MPVETVDYDGTMTKHQIGTLGEKNVHSALKAWYARPGDELEVEVDGFHIDIVRGQLLVEMRRNSAVMMARAVGGVKDGASPIVN